MKFGTLLELNSNIEWWDYYVDYDALKKLFPSNPLDPTYHSTAQDSETSSILPLHRNRKKDKYASPEDFKKALDKEKNKVSEFYHSKLEELFRSFELLQEEITGLEERDLGQGNQDQDDTIKEVDENEDGDEDGDVTERERDLIENVNETDNLLSPTITSPTTTKPPQIRHRPSLVGRLGGGFKRFSNVGGGRRRSIMNNPDEADLLEAQLRPRERSLNRGPSSNNNRSGMNDSVTSSYFDEAAINNNNKKKTRHSSDLESSMDDLGMSTNSLANANKDHDRRTSFSSVSSHEAEFTWPRRRYHSLGLVQMEPSDIPEWAIAKHPDQNDNEDEEAGSGIEGGFSASNYNSRKPIYIWTSNNDYGTVLRIGFKKRISKVWLEAYALKQYVDLNLTAFEKILKKFDKNTNNKLKKSYITNEVLSSSPWIGESKEELDLLLGKILFLYRRVTTSGDEELAKEQLRSQLREKIVVDRETVWSQMVSGHNNKPSGIFRSIEQDDKDLPSSFGENSKNQFKTPLGKFRRPTWLTSRVLILSIALAILIAIVQISPMDGIEESNCLAMLIFCTILWATEAIPLFVTSLAVPLLVVLLRVLRSADGETRLSAADGTKFIFSQMFNPTIMLLIGGFTIAAVLSKTRLDVMTASRILNAAGTKPSVVLLVLMFVATFASMWISNVAAPTLCYALIKPITDELHPKSMFSKCLIIAIALASNIGGQASPISSPQNLISLGSMDPPLSWPQWFAISLPVASLSVVTIWAFLHVNYKWENDLSIPKMRKNTDTLTTTHWYVLIVSGITIALWCAEKSMEGVVGDMGIIAIIPLLAFFGTGILSKEDFHSFHWSIVFLAMGGVALGKATLSSGLLDVLDEVLERLVQGLSLYSILIAFSLLALVIATFISHTIAAVLLVPIATRIGDSLDEPHPRLLIMATALICSAGMGLPVSGFPNMTAITQENKLGQRFIGASDFLKNGIPASILATFVIVTVGYAIMRALGL
ncbi:uncharacterized protein L201_005671 [Kwoniella dendrophila CBS 6074]|uniref:SPX domain-containing protein n=1 Tax=Kwoniella dendrophila CBS 6074 TaxID=1295534 RepID=A0AAX4JZY2_9TREE